MRARLRPELSRQLRLQPLHPEVCVLFYEQYSSGLIWTSCGREGVLEKRAYDPLCGMTIPERWYTMIV